MNNSIKIGFLLIFSFSVSFGAVAGTQQTLQEVNSGSGFRSGYFNYSDSTYARSNAVNAIRVTFTGLTASTDYYIWSRVDEKGATDYNYCKVFPFFSGQNRRFIKLF